ncbi:DivIVA domain-containing protein [Streptomyces sp. NPDC002851]
MGAVHDGFGAGAGLGFQIVRRGYDRAQVDAFVETLSAAAPLEPSLSFDVVRRGYDCGQVDAYLQGLLAGRRLGGAAEGCGPVTEPPAAGPDASSGR